MSRLTRRVLLGILVAQLVGCAAARVKHPESLPHFEAMVPTADGWEVAVFRVPAASTGAAHQGTAVLLAHGTSVNRTNFLLEGSDLAAYLAARGFDVWLTEYRGDRTSRPPDARTWRCGDWDADDIANLDIPAVLDHITAETGRDRVFWVGHSLGGALGYIVAQGSQGDRIAGLVAIGSPGAFVHPNDLARFGFTHRRLLPADGQVPTRSLSRLLAPAVKDHPRSYLIHVITNTANADPARIRAFVGPGMENTGRGLLEQYASWLAGGRLTSRDGLVDYSAGLADIRVPTLLFAGRIDHIVPAWTVRYAHDHLGSLDKTLVTLGVGWGTEQEYGHGDLVVGDRAQQEVFAPIADWLQQHTGEP